MIQKLFELKKSIRKVENINRNVIKINEVKSNHYIE